MNIFPKNKSRFLLKDLSAWLGSFLTVIWLKTINFALSFSHLTSKYTHMIWKTWDNLWIFQLEDVAVYKKIHSQRIHEMLQTKIVMKNKKIKEEYVPGSRCKYVRSICQGRSKINYHLRLEECVWLARLYFYTKSKVYQNLQGFWIELKWISQEKQALQSWRFDGHNVLKNVWHEWCRKIKILTKKCL